MRWMLVVTIPLTLSAAAFAQPRDWAAAVSGNWHVPANWNPADVPDAAAETANVSIPGTYTASFNGSAVIGGLNLTNPNATVAINAGQTMGISGLTVTNAGLLHVNPTQGNVVTTFRMDNAVLSLSGAGTLRLNASGNLSIATISSLDNNFVLTNAAGHTIAGAGTVQSRVTNQGVIQADGNDRTLQLTTNPKTNTSIMRAINGGILRADSIEIANAGGQVFADGVGSDVVLNATGLTGGSLSALNGGLNSASNSALRDVTVAGPLDVVQCTLLALGGSGVTNNGLITVNPSQGNCVTTMRVDSPATTLGGNGVVRLNATGNLSIAMLNPLDIANVLTHGPNHTIAGAGTIQTRMTNQGTIQADVPGGILELNTHPKTNDNLMRAINGGTLRFNGPEYVNSNGDILADGADSQVVLSATGLTGGTLAATNGGTGVVSNSTLRDVSMSGPWSVAQCTVMALGGSGITNDGTITVNPTHGNCVTTLRLDVPAATLGGSGEVDLGAVNNISTAMITTNANVNVLTHAATHTIRGAGTIQANVINNGEIRADDAGQTLQLDTNPKTNNGLMRAVNGATLRFDGPEYANANGQVRAEGTGSQVLLNATGLNGGSVSALSGGLSVASNSTFRDVMVNGPLHVGQCTTLALGGSGITNNGLITVNPSQGNCVTSLRLDVAQAALNGPGTVRLNATSNLSVAVLSTAANSHVLTNAASHSIRGAGTIQVNVLNEGDIAADVAGQTLQLDTNAKTNNGTMRAINGSTLLFNGPDNYVNSNGDVLADGAGSHVALNLTGLNGGTLSAINGASNVASNSTLRDVTVSGPLDVTQCTTLAIAGNGITNNGLITVNPSQGNCSTFFRVDVGAATLDGAGTLRLNATGNLGIAVINTPSNANVLTNGPDHTIAGQGTIQTNVVNQGTISPGFGAAPIGVIDKNTNPLTLTALGTFAVDVAATAAGQFDRLTGNAVVNLDGALQVTPISGYVPVLGHEFGIMTAGAINGVFERIDSPNPGPNLTWRVRYSPTTAVLTVTCPPDLSGDHSVGLSDLTILLSNFGAASGAGGEDGDMDGDGDIDIHDLTVFLAAFGSTCQ